MYSETAREIPSSFQASLEAWGFSHFELPVRLAGSGEKRRLASGLAVACNPLDEADISRPLHGLPNPLAFPSWFQAEISLFYFRCQSGARLISRSR